MSEGATMHLHFTWDATCTAGEGLHSAAPSIGLPTQAHALLSEAAMCMVGVLGTSSATASNDHALGDLAVRIRSVLASAQQGSAVRALRQLSTEMLPEVVQAAELVVQQLMPAAEAAQLQLAQAAAARSCAYLCCTKLRGEGGPEAGQGAGSQHCR